MHNESKFIKDKKEITAEYVDKLKKFIIDNQKEYFSGKFDACSWSDFERGKSKTDREHLVMPDEVLLIDRQEKVSQIHSYIICVIGKNPSYTRVKHIVTVVCVAELNRNYWKNGYFLLPRLD